ncbi:MAG TPA: N-acetyltransferase [Rhodobacteraceae bacterium]|nr:N-acetyltransferase [Paracoccaceae bacterium]
MASGTVPVLETERLRLRQWTAADFEPLADFLGREALNRFRGGALAREQAWEFLSARAGEWQIRGYGSFVIEEKKSGRPAGYAGLWHPFDLAEPELMWSLYPEYHGKGYATEAARAVIDWADRTLHLGPLMSFIHPDNTPSIAVAERLGASIEELTTLRGETRYRYRHVLPAMPAGQQSIQSTRSTNNQISSSKGLN